MPSFLTLLTAILFWIAIFAATWILLDLFWNG